jgi:hypothetical protein
LLAFLEEIGAGLGGRLFDFLQAVGVDRNAHGVAVLLKMQHAGNSQADDDNRKQKQHSHNSILSFEVSLSGEM